MYQIEKGKVYERERVGGGGGGEKSLDLEEMKMGNKTRKIWKEI